MAARATVAGWKRRRKKYEEEEEEKSGKGHFFWGGEKKEGEGCKKKEKNWTKHFVSPPLPPAAQQRPSQREKTICAGVCNHSSPSLFFAAQRPAFFCA